jgi:hypothetical protein
LTRALDALSDFQELDGAGKGRELAAKVGERARSRKNDNFLPSRLPLVLFFRKPR